MSVEITCRDTETGETETQTIEHSQYLVVCGANRYLAAEQLYPTSGTAVITIKTARASSARDREFA